MISTDLLLFFIASSLVVGGGVLVVTVKNIVYAAFALLVAMLGTAGIFLLAFADFLALVQILIYGGAVVVVILFALMLTRIDDFKGLTDNSQKPLAVLASITVLTIMMYAIVSTAMPSSKSDPVSMIDLGVSLFQDWAIPFEVASLVLLVALIGAVVLVRQDDEGR